MIINCAACLRPLYPLLARRTDAGYVHCDCPARTCGDCREALGTKNATGYCKRCQDRRYRAGQSTILATPIRPTCTRCGLPDGPLCDDCLDVAADLREVGRWAA